MLAGNCVAELQLASLACLKHVTIVGIHKLFACVHEMENSVAYEHRQAIASRLSASIDDELASKEERAEISHDDQVVCVLLDSRRCGFSAYVSDSSGRLIESTRHDDDDDEFQVFGRRPHRDRCSRP